MNDTGLYYPYVNLPGDGWVKTAVLLWPLLARIRPVDYPVLHDSMDVERLRDAGLILDVDPGSASSGGAEGSAQLLFLEFLDQHRDQLIPGFGIDALAVPPLEDAVYDELLPPDPRLEVLHPTKMSYRLARELAGAGLLVRQSFRWRRPADGRILNIDRLTMHRELAGVYLTVLADVLAARNGMTPITDQPRLHAAASGWNVAAIAQILLHENEIRPVQADPTQAFAIMALQAVVPRDLDRVPVSRIIEARKRLLPEMLAYREFLDSLTDFFAELAECPDPEIRSARLRLKVESEVVRSMQTMEREIRRLDLQPAKAVLSLQSLAPPAVLGTVSAAAGLSPGMTSIGVAAGCVVGASAATLRRRQEVRAEHPLGYLLGLKQELGPTDLVAKVRSGMRRVSSDRP
ncbi:DUF6236 family protein [Nocardia sp. NPDC127579]|uniref:DUF6236 family protein n=1 Tax=Nocardia sp. NPDC127579 TaxID=3345402 RepID=UPI00362B1752